MFSTFCSTPNERLLLFTTIFSMQPLKFHLDTRLTKTKPQVAKKLEKYFFLTKQTTTSIAKRYSLIIFA